VLVWHCGWAVIREWCWIDSPGSVREEWFDEVGQLAVGSWQLAVGSWQLAVGRAEAILG